MGIKALRKDLCINWEVKLATEASAAHGIANRWRLGKVRHVETCQLWLQQKVANGEVENVEGTENPADALARHLGDEDTKKLVERVGGVVMQGRHELMQRRAKSNGGRETNAANAILGKRFTGNRQNRFV